MYIYVCALFLVKHAYLVYFSKCTVIVCELTCRTSCSPMFGVSSPLDPGLQSTGRLWWTSCGPPYPADLRQRNNLLIIYYIVKIYICQLNTCGCQECMCFFLNAKFSELLCLPVVIKDLDFISRSHILVKMYLLQKRLNQLLHSICYGLMSSEIVAKLNKKVVILINVLLE